MGAQHEARFNHLLRTSGFNPNDYCTPKDLAEKLNCRLERIHWMACAGWINHVRIGGNSPSSSKNKLYAIPNSEVDLIASLGHHKIREILAYVGNHTSGSQRWWSVEKGAPPEKQEKESLATID